MHVANKLAPNDVFTGQYKSTAVAGGVNYLKLKNVLLLRCNENAEFLLLRYFIKGSETFINGIGKT